MIAIAVAASAALGPAVTAAAQDAPVTHTSPLTPPQDAPSIEASGITPPSLLSRTWFMPVNRISNDELPPSSGPRAIGAGGQDAGVTQTPPQPAHTGLAALAYTTWDDFKAFPRRRSTWVILGIGAGAAALGAPADDTLNARLTGSRAVGRFFAPGKYVGAFYTQVGVAAGLYIVGRYVLPPAEGEPRTNKVSHLGFDLIRGLIVSQTLTQAIKQTVRRDRPTGECCAFPSGHASAAFATASVLERHFGYRGAWPTFVIASYVATSRLHDNRHFLSDVLFGSALGIASGWTVVGRHGRDKFGFMPVPTRGGVAIVAVWTPSARPSSSDLR
ncbi:MAG: phosphatase PAP2 family protein [Cyanobacteria bacterium]|nr:phosphatase PAP2 family protein [Cyanobacteriota bacterium]